MLEDHQIGWLGAGQMGSAMAARLLSSGAAVAVWNRTASKAEPLLALGATQADSVAALARCDIVFTMVTSSPDLLALTSGPEGLLGRKGAPQIVVDCSTVSAEAAAEVASDAADHGVQFLSAPISGNPDMVREGHASIVASGPLDVFDTVKPYLHAIAPTVVYSGAGQESRLVKLCHNLLLGMITEALAETTVLAVKGGVEPSDFLDFIDGSVLASTFIKAKGSAIRNRDYQPTFSAENLRKDFDLGLGAARTLEVPMPIASATYQLLQTLIGRGYRDADYVALYELAALAAGLPPTDPSD